MNFHDPARPRLNHRPCYIDQAHRRIAPLPDLLICPAPLGGWDITVWLKINRPAPWKSSGFTQYFCHLDTETDVVRLLVSYEFEPEQALKEFFGYAGPGEEGPKSPVNDDLALEDLGL